MQRNKAYTKWLSSGNRPDLVRFRVARSETRKIIRSIKNEWFRERQRELNERDVEESMCCNVSEIYSA